jgi:hypothetical protein
VASLSLASNLDVEFGLCLGKGLVTLLWKSKIAMFLFLHGSCVQEGREVVLWKGFIDLKLQCFLAPSFSPLLNKKIIHDITKHIKVFFHDVILKSSLLIIFYFLALKILLFGFFIYEMPFEKF